MTMHRYTLRIFQFTTAGENQTPADEHVPVASYENLTAAPVVPQIGTYFHLRDPSQRDHRVCAGRVHEVVTVLYGTFTVVEIYLAPKEGKRARPENELELLKLAAYFQDDYAKKLPVIAAFRQWRSGVLTTEQFLAFLRADGLGALLRYEGVPPMRGLALLNDYIPE
jgi:hypothetical protein